MRLHVRDNQRVGLRIENTLRDQPSLLLDRFVTLDRRLVRHARTLQHLRVGPAVEIHTLQFLAPGFPGLARAPLEMRWAVRQAARPFSLRLELLFETMNAELARVALGKLQLGRFWFSTPH